MPQTVTTHKSSYSLVMLMHKCSGGFTPPALPGRECSYTSKGIELIDGSHASRDMVCRVDVTEI